jgi:hypothetical protein
MRITRSIQTIKLCYIGGLLLLFILGMMAMRFAASYVSSISGGAAILDLNFGNNTAHINHTLTALGEAGRSAYLHVFLPIDTCYAAIYAVFYACTLAFFVRRLPLQRWKLGWARWIVVLPVVAAACDWWENVVFALMLSQFPVLANPALVASTTVATRAKFILVYLSLLLVVGFAVYHMVRWIATKYSSSNNDKYHHS